MTNRQNCVGIKEHRFYLSSLKKENLFLYLTVKVISTSSINPGWNLFLFASISQSGFYIVSFHKHKDFI